MQNPFSSYWTTRQGASLGFFVMCVLVLAGCARPTGLDAVRSDAWLRAERNLPMTNFAQVQKALFEHARLCGSAPSFALIPRGTNEAVLTYALDNPPQRQRTVLVDLQQISTWDGLRIRAQAYASFAVGEDVVQQVFDAVLDPAACPSL